MKTLHLNLKRQWFDMIKSGEKKEEYREINPKWCNRFLLFGGKQLSQKFWKDELEDQSISDFIENVDLFSTFKQFKDVRFGLGYPKRTDALRNVNREFLSISIKEGRPEWGAVKGEKYFALELGEIIEKPNCRLGYENDEDCITAPCCSCRYND